MTLLADQIKNAALDLGYEKCGIIKISDTDGYKEKLEEHIIYACKDSNSKVREMAHLAIEKLNLQ